METFNFEYTFQGTTGRAFCKNCDFLKSRCLCQWIKLIPNQTHLIILQHPSETKHALNTARIMTKCFKEISLFVGEDFSENVVLNTLMSNPDNNIALLYPEDGAIAFNKTSASTTFTHLILLDGTWRKAKKIYLSSMNLQTLPKLSLSPQEAGQYRIRKSPHTHALSTIEAAVAALNICEPTLDTKAAILSFKKMIDMQIEKMGFETYQNNYLDKKKE